jgi:hypothetical protein
MSEGDLDEYEETFPLVDRQITLFAVELEILVDLDVAEVASSPTVYRNVRWTAEGCMDDGLNPREKPKPPVTEELEPKDLEEEGGEPEVEPPASPEPEIKPESKPVERDHYAEFRVEFQRVFRSKDKHWIDKTEELLWLLGDAPSDARLRSIIGDDFDEFNETIRILRKDFYYFYDPLPRRIPTGGFTGRPKGANDYDARIIDCYELVKAPIVANQATSEVVRIDQKFAQDAVFPAIRKQGGYIEAGDIGEKVAGNIYGTRAPYHANTPKLIEKDESEEKPRARKREEERTQ